LQEFEEEEDSDFEGGSGGDDEVAAVLISIVQPIKKTLQQCASTQ
jgi:hypothetical protein